MIPIRNLTSKNIYPDASDECNHLAPIVAPATGFTSVAVAHPGLIFALRQQLVDFFASQPPYLDAHELRSDLNELSDHGYVASINTLVGDKPIYNVVYRIDASQPSMDGYIWVPIILLLVLIGVGAVGASIAYLIQRRKKKVTIRGDPNDVEEEGEDNIELEGGSSDQDV